MTLSDASDTGRAAHLKTDSVFSVLIKGRIIHRRLNEHGCHLWEQPDLSVWQPAEFFVACSHAAGHIYVCV